MGSVQDYISTNQLAEYSVRDVGWITAILVFLTLFLGVQVGPLFDRYGPRILLVWISRQHYLLSSAGTMQKVLALCPLSQRTRRHLICCHYNRLHRRAEPLV